MRVVFKATAYCPWLQGAFSLGLPCLPCLLACYSAPRPWPISSASLAGCSGLQSRCCCHSLHRGLQFRHCLFPWGEDRLTALCNWSCRLLSSLPCGNCSRATEALPFHLPARMSTAPRLVSCVPAAAFAAAPFPSKASEWRWTPSRPEVSGTRAVVYGKRTHAVQRLMHGSGKKCVTDDARGFSSGPRPPSFEGLGQTERQASGRAGAQGLRRQP